MAKYLKYKHNKLDCGYVMVDEHEARLGYDDKAYVSVSEGGVTISGGQPSKVLFNTMSPIYGGMVRDTPYPLSMIPGPMSPPKQVPNIPLEELLPMIKDMASMVQAMASLAV